MQSGHESFFNMVENALKPLCPVEILDFITDQKDTYCSPDNQVVLCFL